MVFIIFFRLHFISFIRKIANSNYSWIKVADAFDNFLLNLWLYFSPSVGKMSQGILLMPFTLSQVTPSSTGDRAPVDVYNRDFNNELIALASIFISTIPLIIAQFVRLNQDTTKTAIVNNKMRLEEISLQNQQKDQKISENEIRIISANDTIAVLKEQIIDLKSEISNRNLLFSHISTIIQISLREDNLEQIKNQLTSIITLIENNQPKSK